MHDVATTPAGWTPQGYEAAQLSVCDLLEAVRVLDAAVTRVPVLDPARVLDLVDQAHRCLHAIKAGTGAAAPSGQQSSI